MIGRIACALGFAAMLAACSPTTSTGGAERSAGKLVIAESQEPQSANPLFLTGANSATLPPLLYSYLLTFNERNELVPDAATEVPRRANGGISADGLTITYHLRPGIRWHDGAPLTARDVVFSYHAILNPANNVPSRTGYEGIRSIEAVGDTTIRLHLPRPDARVLGLFLAPNQNYPILPAHLLAKYRDLNQIPFNQNPVGSGPFRFAEWSRGDHMRLLSNAAYFRGKPAISEINLRFVSDSNSILNQLKTGEINADFVADPAHLAEYSGIAAERVVRAPLAGIGDLFFNVADPDLSDVRLRRALVEAAGLPHIVRNATKGAQTIADGNRGMFSWGYDPAVPPPRDDATAAAALFETAGWTRHGDGVRTKAGRPLVIQLSYVSGNATAGALAVQLQQQLAGSGVQLTLHSYAPAQFRAPASAGGPIFGGKYQMAFLEIYTLADPDTQWYLGCREFPPHGFNLSRFCDPAVDVAENAGLATYDPAARRRFAGVVQRRIAETLPFVALWQQNAVYVVPAGLKHFAPSPLSALWNAGAWSF